MTTRPETEMGPGAGTPEPRCIAYLANALRPYTLGVIEGNQNTVGLAIERAGGICFAFVIDPTCSGLELAEAPENAL